MNRQEFIDSLELLGISITNDQLKQLASFYNLLIEWNEKINLTAIVEEKEVYLKHFYDSLTLVKVVDLSGDLSLCDVGSGAGFPGIVLKIMFPNLRITLIDSLNKRIIYLNDVIKRLELKNIEAIHVRMEDYSKLNVEKFDIITARAVASISVLAEVSVVALKIEGKLIFMKANGEEELKDAKNAFDKLKLEVINVVNFLLPIENSNRMLVSACKKARTDSVFPRNMDKIRKKPL